MKKNFLLPIVAIATICIAENVQAQRPVGDTVREAEATYFYNYYTKPENWFNNPDSNSMWFQAPQTSFPDCVPFLSNWLEYRNGNGISGMQMYSDKPLKILGIAAVATMQRWLDTTCSYYMSGWYHHPGLPEDNSEMFPGVFFPNTLDTTIAGRVTDSLILYQTTVKVPRKLAAAPWRIEYPHRYMYLPNFTGYRRDRGYVYDEAILPLYEAMFDKPVVVDDSFIVAGTFRNNEKILGWHKPPNMSNSQIGSENMYLWNHQPTRYIVSQRYCLAKPYMDSSLIIWFKMDDSCTFWQRKLVSQYQNNPHPPGTYNWSMLLYPIIDPVFDTVICHDVTNVTVAERSGSNATLMWNSRDPGPFEVAYGKYTDPWENFIHLTTNDPPSPSQASPEASSTSPWCAAIAPSTGNGANGPRPWRWRSTGRTIP